jgi:hypothetical protein
MRILSLSLMAALALAGPVRGLEPRVDRCVGASAEVLDQHPSAEVCPPPLPGNLESA